MFKNDKQNTAIILLFISHTSTKIFDSADI